MWRVATNQISIVREAYGVQSEMVDFPWAYAGGAALVTLLASGWGYVRSFWAQISSRLIVTVQVTGFQSEAVQLLLREKFVPSRMGPREYIGCFMCAVADGLS